ncbi:ATP-grasp domain-containing protein [Candidatus Odyssella thessalonicensis]|uniref:ATP-grasp domain-containing protein n=1 Tax=Candidatus Odyssella thessalonicensis TaxID=84647 RepID=UPI000225B94C|nr:ATP-grasp domain-containing protein [Candidatus Odyssella thessalonicensis]
MSLFQFLLINFAFLQTLAFAAEESHPVREEAIVVLSKSGTKRLEADKFLSELPCKTIVVCMGEKEDIQLFSKNDKLIVCEVPEYVSSQGPELALLQLTKSYNIVGLCANTETDITRAAFLREYFNIPGQDANSAFAFRNKIRMKEILSKNNVRVPRFIRAHTIFDVIKFSSENPFPLIMKPVDEAGAKDVTLLKNAEDIKKLAFKKEIFFSNNPGWDLEEFIEGTMFHIDGLTQNNKVLVAWPSQYVNQCMECVSGKFTGSYMLSPDDSRVSPILEYTQQVIRSLPDTKGSAFHLEIFQKNSGEIVFCEIGSRVGGGFIRLDWQKCFGLDLLEQHFALQAGLPATKYQQFPTDQTGFVLMYSKGGKVKEVKDISESEDLLFLDTWLRPGDIVENPASLSDTIGLVAFRIKHSNNPINEVEKWAQRLKESIIIE